MESRPPAAAPAPVPVLLYHAITETPGSHIAPFAVPPATFARHLDLLVDGGFRCLTMGELLARTPGLHTGERVAVVTFDDGYADFAAAALPALVRRSVPATLYLTTGWLAGGAAREPGPSDPMLSWSQLPELLDAGVELGAHSHRHPQLDTLGAAALREELTLPKYLLEQALGRPVPGLAYPHGYSGPRVRHAARAAGYGSAAAVRNALHVPDEDPFRISRLTVGAATTDEELARWLDGDPWLVRPADRPVTTAWRLYRRVRALVRRRPGSDYR